MVKLIQKNVVGAKGEEWNEKRSETKRKIGDRRHQLCIKHY